MKKIILLFKRLFEEPDIPEGYERYTPREDPYDINY